MLIAESVNFNLLFKYSYTNKAKCRLCPIYDVPEHCSFTAE